MLKLETVEQVYLSKLIELEKSQPRKVRLNRKEAAKAALSLIQREAHKTPDGCKIIFYVDTVNLGTKKWPDIMYTWDWEFLDMFHETEKCYVSNFSKRRISKDKIIGYGIE